MAKIRIALMTSTIDGRTASGTALVARKCIEALLRQRDAFDLTFIHYEKSDDPIYQHGVKEIILPRLRPDFLNRRSFRFMYYVLTTRDSFDIMQWFQPRLYPLFWRAPVRKIIVTVHGAGDITDNKVHFIFSRTVYNWTLRMFRRSVTLAIAGSEFARRDVIEKYWFHPDQVVAVNNGVDPSFVRASDEEIAHVKKKYNLPQHPFFLGVGRMVPSKNVPRIIRAFERFCASSPREEIALVHIGTRGPDRDQVDALIAKSFYQDRVRLQGFIDQEDLPAVYSAAYALIFPLLNEGFGLPAIEAMACGTPTLISNTAAPEITKREALLVDALDEVDIARGMRELAEDSDLRERLITAGCSFAKQCTWEVMGEKVVDLYRRVAA